MFTHYFSDLFVPEGTASIAYYQSCAADETGTCRCGAGLETVPTWRSSSLFCSLYVCQSRSAGGLTRTHTLDQ